MMFNTSKLVRFRKCSDCRKRVALVIGNETNILTIELRFRRTCPQYPNICLKCDAAECKLERFVEAAEEEQIRLMAESSAR